MSTSHFMYTYQGYMCIYVQNIKFLRSSLWPGGLPTDDYARQRKTRDRQSIIV